MPIRVSEKKNRFLSQNSNLRTSLESPSVLENFAKIALLRLKRHEEIIGSYTNPPFSSILNADHQKRREIVRFIVPMLHDPEKDSKYLVFNVTPLVINKDIPWLIDRFQAEEIKENQLVWAQLIMESFDCRKSEQLDAIFTACSSSPILEDKFQYFFKPVKLDSPEAQKMKNDYLERKKNSEKIQNVPLIKPPPSECIAKLLDDFQSGELDAWWRLNMEMTLQPDGIRDRDELESDLTVLYGWKSADTRSREKIVEAAKIYLNKYNPQTHKWLGTNSIHRPAFAGYRAFLLLLREEPDYIFTIQDHAWENWSSTILAYPTWDNNELVELAYKHAPNEIIKTLMILIDKENEEHDHIFIIQKVKNCWDERLANAILIKAKDTNMKPDCMGKLLGILLENKVREAKDFAESLVSLEHLANENGRSRAVVAAIMLLNHAEDGGWKVVWPLIQKDAEFGKEVISAVANDSGHVNNIEHLLTEEQLADLYIWISRQYPHADDPKYDCAHIIESREEIAHWRDSILQNLKNLGTHKSCEAISRISSELPDLDWLKWTLLEAQNITRRNTWVPPQPLDILKMVTNQHTHNPIDQQIHDPNVKKLYYVKAINYAKSNQLKCSFTCLAVILFIVLCIFHGPPSEISVFGLTWDLDDIDNEVIVTSNITPYHLSSELLSIEDLKPRQQIYGLKENASVDFVVTDEKNIPYNISALWYYNNTRYFGWTNSNNMTGKFYSEYPVSQKGEWKIQVVLEWEYLNQTYTKDNITYIEVF